MIRIMLACAGGMSTSLLMNKMKEEADNRGLEVSVAPELDKCVKIFFGKTLTEPAVNNNAADSATILPIPKITPVKIPGIALGNNTVLIIYHLVAPISNAASR